MARAVSLRLLAAAGAIMVSLVGSAAASAEEIRVAAASDLTGAFKRIADGYESKTGDHIALVFGASGMLSRQIIQGAPFDLFASAGTSFIDQCCKAGKVDARSVRPYALGHLVLYSNVAKLPTSLDGLTASTWAKIAIANPQTAPYGIAAAESLRSAGIYERVFNRLVIGENIQQAFEFARSRNATAGIVSASQTKGITGYVLPIPDALHKPILQTIAIVSESAHAQASRHFIDFLTGPEGQRILKSFGYTSPSTARP